MKIGRIVLFTGSLWETFRFLVVFLFVVSFTGLVLSPTRILLLSWLGGIQLTLVVGYLFVGLYYDQYARFTKIMAFGKLLNLFPAVLIIVFEFGDRSLLVESLMKNDPVSTIELGTFIFIVIVIALLDLLFLIFLLSCKIDIKSEVKPETPSRSTLESDVQVLTVEEE